ncbi:pentapeptide repeat-containing protein [Escherichia albertii]|uniref:pentapeptide repeat-containing protein n=1 Tax=Escherichia albertii TaxID=208962 RepID=UPI0010F9CDF7|nr:pentapeptide repeat-containing protein [Escherichia albertii]
MSSPVQVNNFSAIDFKESLEPTPKQNIFEWLWDKIHDFFCNSEKDKVKRAIKEFINIKSDLNADSAQMPDSFLNINSNSTIDDYLNIRQNNLSAIQKQYTLCRFWNNIASATREISNNSFHHKIEFAPDQDGKIVMKGAIIFYDKVVRDYSIALETDENGKLDLRGLCLAHTTISTQNMEGFNLSGVDLKNSKLFYVDLKDANCTSSNFAGCIFENCNLNNTDCNGANINNTMLPGKGYNNENKRGNDLEGIILRNSSCIGSNLSWVDLSKSDCRGANFSSCNLSNITIPDKNQMEDTTLNQAILSNVHNKNKKDNDKEQYNKFIKNYNWDQYTNKGEQLKQAFKEIVEDVDDSEIKKSNKQFADVIIQYLISDKNPHPLHFNKEETIKETKNNINLFMKKNSQSSDIFNKATAPGIIFKPQHVKKSLITQYKKEKLNTKAIENSLMRSQMAKIIVDSNIDKIIRQSPEIINAIHDISLESYSTINETIDLYFEEIVNNIFYKMNY